MTAEPDGDVLRLSLPEGGSAEEAAASIEVLADGPPGTPAAIPLGVEDGEARFRLPASPPGTGLARVRLARRGPDGSAALLPPVSYLPRAGRVDETGPSAPGLARALGAAAEPPDASDLFHVPERQVPGRIPLWPWLVGLGLALLPFDAWAHRRAPARRVGP